MSEMLSGGIGGAGAGASAGFQMGGPWGAVAGAIIGGVAGIVGGKKNKRRRKRAERLRKTIAQTANYRQINAITRQNKAQAGMLAVAQQATGFSQSSSGAQGAQAGLKSSEQQEVKYANLNMYLTSAAQKAQQKAATGEAVMAGIINAGQSFGNAMASRKLPDGGGGGKSLDMTKNWQMDQGVKIPTDWKNLQF